jgi:hypothetical protein
MGNSVVRDRVWRWSAPAILVVASIVIARIVQQDGHGWGDDFALYINQARGLVEGTASQVVADNRFAVDNSAFRDFTPIAYPWGTSLALMPIIAIFGIDYSMLKLVPTAALAMSVALVWLIARRRLGPIGAVIPTAFMAFNPWYLWATDAVLSDLIFLAATLLVVVLADRVVAHDTMFVLASRDVTVLVITIAAAAHVRREGLGLIAVLVALQAARWFQPDRPPTTRAVLFAPWAWLIGSFTVLHVLFPAPIRADLDTQAPAGIGSIAPNVSWYRNAIAELFGFQRIGDVPTQAFGSVWLGWVWLAVMISLAGLGAIVAIVAVFRRSVSVDLALTAALIGVGSIVSMAPYHYQRYLMTIAVLIMLLAASTIWSIGQRIMARRTRGTTVVALAMTVVLFTPSMVLHLTELANSLRYHTTTRFTVRGPEDGPTQELWTAVVTLTDEADVVMFAQPRSMNLYTRRRSVVGNDRNVLLRRADWYAMERESDYLQVPLSSPEAERLGLSAEWENERYILYRVPERSG